MKEVTIKGVLDVINKSESLEINENQIEANLSDMGMDSINFIQIIVGLEDSFD